MKLTKHLTTSSWQTITINPDTAWAYCIQYQTGHQDTVVWEGYLCADPNQDEYNLFIHSDPDVDSSIIATDQELLVYVGQLQSQGWRYNL